MEASSQNLTENKPALNLKDLEEVIISIAAKDLNPTMLSAEFLKMSGIVPNEWELARQPITNPRGSQVSFKNGVNVIAQPGTVSFAEALNNKNLKQLNFVQVVQQYVQKLPNAEYQGLSINPKVIVPFSEAENGKKFIMEKLIAPGPWQEFGTTPPSASLNLFYQLAQCQLTLTINPARLQQPDQSAISAVLFSGNFTYNLTNLVGNERLKQLGQKINNWDQDLDIFRELVYEKFLQKAVPQTENLFNV
jgi:hypothetical protein